MTALLHPDEGETELDHGVPDDVEWGFVDEINQDRVAVRGDPQSAAGQAFGEPLPAVLDLDGERPGSLGERPERSVPEQLAVLDREQVVAHALDLAQQVRCDDDGKPELGARPMDQLEHLVAAGGVKTV